MCRVQVLERNWKTIREEALAVLDQSTRHFVPEEENLREKGDWGQYTLWQQGAREIFYSPSGVVLPLITGVTVPFFCLWEVSGRLCFLQFLDVTNSCVTVFINNVFSPLCSRSGRKVGNACQGVPKTCALLERFPEATGCKRGQVQAVNTVISAVNFGILTGRLTVGAPSGH